MGTGKSRLIVEYVRRAKPKRTLILCPRGVIPVWPAQFDRFVGAETILVAAPTKGSVADRLDAIRKAWDAAGDAPLVIVINHEAAWREPMGTALLRPTWDLVVCDELHRAAAPGGVFSRWLTRVGKKARKRVGLSGTPFCHSPLSVYAQMRFLDPSIFGVSHAAFRARYAVMGGYRVDGRPVEVVGYQNLDELHERFYRIADRVRKEDVLDLPATMHETIRVELPSHARKIYAEIEDEMISEVDAGTVTAQNALVKLLRLAQITSGHVRTEAGVDQPLHDAKSDALAELLGDLPDDEPVVVFYRFDRARDAILDGAERAGRPTDEVSGRRKTVGAEWAPRPGAVLAAQLKAGGVGISLTAARYCVFFDLDFSLADHEQCLARTHRGGQTRKVTYYTLSCVGTVDVKIAAALRARKNVVEAVLDGLRRGAPA